jgi:hypothetical protein
MQHCNSSKTEASDFKTEHSDLKPDKEIHYSYESQKPQIGEEQQDGTDLPYLDGRWAENYDILNRKVDPDMDLLVHSLGL